MELRRGSPIVWAMRRHAIVLGVGLLGLVAFAALAGWAVFSSHRAPVDGRSPGSIWPYVACLAIVLASLAGSLMWLAGYSASHGYDDRIEPEGR